MTVRLGVVCALGVGPHRGGRAENEDNFLVCHTGTARWLEGPREHREPVEGDGTLLAVCDGMGGHDGGRLASTTAVRVLAKLYRSARPADPAANLLRYVREAHGQLHRRALEIGPVRMGTTLTACWILEDRVAWVHVGDSRLYLLRDGVARQLTRDHTYNEFARRDGRAEVARDDLCQGFIYGSRGLGDDAALRLEPGVDNGAEPLRAGDRLLLCSDGITRVLDDEALAEAVGPQVAPQTAAEGLLATALDAGSTDNVTAVVAALDAR